MSSSSIFDRNTSSVTTTQGTGTVKLFDANLGFGIITPVDPSLKNLFVHVNTVRRAGLADTLTQGHTVSYTASTLRHPGFITEIAIKTP